MVFNNVDAYESRPYEAVRSFLAPAYQNLPPETIEQILRQTFGETLDPEDAENFFKSLGKVASAALPVAGTVVGTAFGGPVGGAVGGALGSLAGNAVGAATAPRPQAPRPQAPRPQAPRPQVPRPQMTQPRPPMAPRPASSPMPSQPVAQPVAQPVPQPIPQPVMPPVQPGMSPMQPTMATPAAPANMASILPQLMQFIAAALLGNAGRQSVSVGDLDVSMGAFANLLNGITNQAAIESNAMASHSEEFPRYLMDANGTLLADPAVPEQRAGVLLNLAQQANYEQFQIAEHRNRLNQLHRQRSHQAELEQAAIAQAELDELYSLELAQAYLDYDSLYDDWQEDNYDAADVVELFETDR